MKSWYAVSELGSDTFSVRSAGDGEKDMTPPEEMLYGLQHGQCVGFAILDLE
jgi:hypothetical protein